MGAPRAVAVAPGLWLVVADAPLDRYGAVAIDRRLHDLDWVSACALAHEAMVEHVARLGTVVPMKLFTLFTTDARALAHVRRRRRALAQVIRRIAGRQEWGVRIRAEATAARRDGRPPAARASAAPSSSCASGARRRRASGARPPRRRRCGGRCARSRASATPRGGAPFPSRPAASRAGRRRRLSRGDGRPRPLPRRGGADATRPHRGRIRAHPDRALAAVPLHPGRR